MCVSGSSERHIWTDSSGLTSGMGGRRPGVLSASSGSKDGEKKSSAATARHSSTVNQCKGQHREGREGRQGWVAAFVAKVMGEERVANLACLSSSCDLMQRMVQHGTRLLERWLLTARMRSRLAQAELQVQQAGLYRKAHRFVRLHAPSSLSTVTTLCVKGGGDW